MSHTEDPPPGRREQNKARRRTAITDAARQLLREFEIDKITVERIAERADVAPATVYNLVGTREAVFAALMQDLLSSLATELEGLSAEDPVGYAEAIVSRSVDRFVDDPLVHGQLIGMLMNHRRDTDQHEAGMDAAYLQVGNHAQPEVGPFPTFTDPMPQYIPIPFQINPQNDVYGHVLNLALLSQFDMDRIQIDNRIYLVQRPALPRLYQRPDFVGNGTDGLG